MVFKPFVAVVSFLTIIPTFRHGPSTTIDISYIATSMYLFPLAGALIGLLAGLVGYGLSLALEPNVTSLLVVLFITLITGLHHTDALADFGDGLMAKRGRESKKNAMHDHSIGSAGATALILYFMGIFTTLSSIREGTVLLSFLLTSEVIAKYMMVEQAHFGKAAWDGLSSPFILAMKNKMKFIIQYFDNLGYRVSCNRVRRPPGLSNCISCCRVNPVHCSYELWRNLWRCHGGF